MKLERVSRKLFEFKEFRRWFGEAVNLVSPPRCILCGTFQGPFPGGNCCAPCWSRLQHAERIVPPDVSVPGFRAFCSGSYTGALRELILKAKYGADPASVSPLRRLLRETAARTLEGPVSAVTCVPAHSDRLKRRGFDLPYDLARDLARSLGAPFRPGLLERVRPTVPQQELPREERLRNLEGAFSSSEAPPPGLVVVVDDVVTTGATALAVARALSAAGALGIFFLALARTPEHADDRAMSPA